MRFACVALMSAAMLAACTHRRAADLTKPSTQENFGVEMAQMNLWREAMFRFQRAVDLNPSDAMAHNNLAVAYEANGDFENAAKEYKEALRLDRANTYIQKNYSRYTEFMSRSKKRQQKSQPKSATAAEPAIKPLPPASIVPDATSAGPPETTPPPERRPPGGL